MSAKDKNGLGYGTQLDEMSNKSETDSEISIECFLRSRQVDEEITPENDMFSKADGYHVVPPPIIGNFLTPRANISFAGLDEYAIRKKIIESKTIEPRNDTSEIVGKTNEVNIEKPKSVHESVVPKPKINRDKVIIEDWYSDDEDDVSEVNTVSPECGPNWMFDLDFLTNTMNYIPVSVENQVNVDAGTQEHYVAGSSEKDKEPTQEYILLPLHPHRPRILVEDVVQAAQEKPSENSPKDNDVQDSEDVADKEEQHTLTEAEQALKDDLERMIAQEIAAKAIDNATRQAFEEVGKEGRKKSKPKSTLDDSTVFDDHDADHGMEYIETEEAVDEGRQSGETEECCEPETPPTTTSIFDDEDITMAQTLIKMKEEKAKEKGVSIKDVDDSSRPARSILTLKPLPIIDPKDKGKGVLKESPVKKVKRSDLDAAQIAKDAEIARLVHEKELAEMEREREERQRQDQASVDYIASLYDEVQAKMDASEELAARLQMEERERCKYRHNQLNKKTFKEIQALYIKEQERYVDFVPIGSEKDEKMIDKMNKKAAGMDKEEVPEESESTNVKVKKEGLHILALEDGTKIHMLVEKRYPLIRETLERMMELRLTAESEGEAIFDLLRFIQKKIDNAPCYSNEALAIPEQTATGKEISNPFMAGSLPKLHSQLSWYFCCVAEKTGG
ncbi:hypothetical protein Tco_1408658 [Tanacetum coccineum]